MRFAMLSRILLVPALVIPITLACNMIEIQPWSPFDHWSQQTPDVSASASAPEEIFAVCRAYARGEGLPQDDRKAIEWCRTAAEQGYQPAETELARLERRRG